MGSDDASTPPRESPERTPVDAPTIEALAAKIRAAIGRPRLRFDPARHAAALEGRVVLVTGAAGSIGSALLDRLPTFDVAEIVALDSDRRVAASARPTAPRARPLEPVVGDVRDVPFVDALFARKRPDVVLHAAALKHVVASETRPIEAADVNVGGTLAIAAAAARRGARMILVSTDKAAAPLGVMGATKNVAERAATSAIGGATPGVATRLCNVLGSRGSVLWTFAAALMEGRAPRVSAGATRFFVDVDEAVEAILAATWLAEPGDVLAPDFEPAIDVARLARVCVEAFGGDPDAREAFVQRPLAPGEKRDETLFDPREIPLSTSEARVRRVRGRGFDVGADEAPEIAALLRAVARTDAAAVLDALEAASPGYVASAAARAAALSTNAEERA